MYVGCVCIYMHIAFYSFLSIKYTFSESFNRFIICKKCRENGTYLYNRDKYTHLEQGQFSLARAVSNREIVHVVYGLIVSSRKMRKSFFGLGSGIQQTDFYSITVHQFS